MAQNKTTPSTAKAKSAKAVPSAPKSVKPIPKIAASKAAAPKAAAPKPTSKPAAPKVAAATVAKSVNGAGATIKKPLPSGKSSASAAVAKPAAKNPTPKVEMSQSAVKSAVKKVETHKGPAAKIAVVKPSLTPLAKHAPATAKPQMIPTAKPQVVQPAKAHSSPAAKPQAPMAMATKPASPGVKPAAPIVGARPLAPVGAKPGVPPPFRPGAPGLVKPGLVKPGLVKPGMVRPGAPGIVAPKAHAGGAPAAPAADAGPKKPVSSRHGFKTNEWIVYPAHGVGRITAIDEQEIAGMALELFVITFEKDKLTLRVPTGKAQQVGMRKLAEDGVVRRAMETLKGKARIKRTMWSRRAQEFEAKINSGDLVSIAEVVRDLYRAENQPEQSYSERQLYEAALDRMSREIAAVDKIDERTASQRVVEVLSKSAKGRKAAGEEAAAAAAAAASEDDADVKAA